MSAKRRGLAVQYARRNAHYQHLGWDHRSGSLNSRSRAASTPG